MIGQIVIGNPIRRRYLLETDHGDCVAFEVLEIFDIAPGDTLIGALRTGPAEWRVVGRKGDVLVDVAFIGGDQHALEAWVEAAGDVAMEPAGAIQPASRRAGRISSVASRGKAPARDAG